MNLMFDTSILIEIQEKNQAVINKVEELKKIYPGHPKVPFISYVEFVGGLKEKSIKNKQILYTFIESFEFMPVKKGDANALILLQDKYEFPINDLLIAAQVLENDGILITKDRDFKDIEEIEKIILE